MNCATLGHSDAFVSIQIRLYFATFGLSDVFVSIRIRLYFATFRHSSAFEFSFKVVTNALGRLKALTNYAENNDYLW